MEYLCSGGKSGKSNPAASGSHIIPPTSTSAAARAGRKREKIHMLIGTHAISASALKEPQYCQL